MGSLQKYPKEQLLMQIVFQTDPEKKDKLAGIVVDELKFDEVKTKNFANVMNNLKL